MGVLDILNKASFPIEKVPLCLEQHLDLQYTEALKRQANLATVGPQGRLAKPDDPELAMVDAEIRDLAAQMAGSTITLHIQGISSVRYNELQRTSGRPRKDNKADAAVGFNLEAFYYNATRVCTIKVTSADGDEVTFTDEQWGLFFESLTDGQFDRVCTAVQKVNRGVVSAPFEPKNSAPVLNSVPKS